jgi:extracellular elastinolytic metalloproteinase
MNATFTKTCFFLMLLFLSAATLEAQKQSPLDIALRHLEQARESWQLTAADIADVTVSDQYQTRHNGVTHLYFMQRHAGIPLYNAINGIHITRDGKVAFATNRFVTDLASRANATAPALTAYQAIEAAATHLELIIDGPLRLLQQTSAQELTFEGGNISLAPIKVKLMYQLTADQRVRLAWDLAIDMPNSADYWSLRIDALDGKVLDQNNWTVHCSFDEPHHHQAGHECGIKTRQNQTFRPVGEALEMANRSMLVDGAQYRVYPAPAESPRHGNLELIGNPADTTASPYGWHDTDGQPGPEFTITRGNNVHAYLDLSNSNTSTGDEPNGGNSLIFDFPLDLSQEPAGYRDAAVTQLFYMNNYIHDFAYAYGFDEPAGNFQQNNYGNGGMGNDFVNAEAQDGGGTNNANFSTPPDGVNGRMQMYLWSSGGSSFRVESPQPVAGGYDVQLAAFGGIITATPVTGPVIVVDDGTSQGSLGCNPLTNADQIQGAIALIDRGVCEFGLKALLAQQAGAIGVIICNFEDALVSMGAGTVGAQVTIPVISMQLTDCQTIRQFAGQDLVATFQLPDADGPSLADASLDNGIVAHEYGHGISNRLTGGPAASGCLSNDEQMGEGWSDFFTLVTAVKPGDTGEQGRGIGTYVLGQDPTGPGIRRRRYSTDFTVNNQVLDDIKGTTAPHPLGEIWTTTLWDLYWAFVDEYGWDEDQIHGTGGNNMAIRLVMDGMKLQACSPGFNDGRDAILAADLINYDGAHECLIWSVFARRGIGYFADQGTSGSRNDNVQDFEPKPECIKELKISKQVTPFINPGEDITVTLTVTNHKGVTAGGVLVEDIVPAGTFYVAGSTSGANVEAEGELLKFDLGDLADGEVRTITYRLSSDPAEASIRLFFDDMEDGFGENTWFYLNLDGINIWGLTTLDANSGQYAWYVPNAEAENDQIVQLIEPILITGEQPVMRFFHRYETELGFDGGFLEVSTDGGFTWEQVNDKMIRNGYVGRLNYSTFAIPFLEAFHGNSGGWIPTFVDFSAYRGQEITFRFRFGSDAEGAPSSPNPGWYVDDIELMDLVNYNTEACVTSSQGDLACAIAPDRGTLVESAVISNTSEEKAQSTVRVFPNPARSQVNVSMMLDAAQPVLVQLVSADGRVLAQQKQEAAAGFQLFTLNTSQLPAGMYFVKVYAGTQTSVEKVIIR